MRLTPARLLLAGAVLLGAVAVVLWLAPSRSYIYLPDRARPVEPLIAVPHEQRAAGTGGVYLVDVFVRKATLLESLFPGIRSGATVVPESAVAPPGISGGQLRTIEQNEMSRSQELAAAVALRALGRRVKARPTGALVDAIAQDSPAVSKLRPSDVIVSLDGKRVRTLRDLRRAVGPLAPGTRVRVGVRRGSELETVTLRTARDPHRRKRSVIGIFVEQEADVHLPVRIRIDSEGIGGPSAGLAFALGIMEDFGRDIDHGYRVAATGEIELDGGVLPVGGLKQKTLGARNSHIEVFLVPAGQNAREARRYASGLRVVPVRSFEGALKALAALPPRA